MLVSSRIADGGEVSYRVIGKARGATQSICGVLYETKAVVADADPRIQGVCDAGNLAASTPTQRGSGTCWTRQAG